MKKVAGLLLGAMLLQGCAAAVQGKYQEMQVNTNPPNATCSLAYDDGPAFAYVSGGEKSYAVRRGSRDITVTCSKPGYSTVSTVVKPSTDNESAGFQWLTGNLDVFSGTVRVYPESVDLRLQRLN